MPSPPTAGSPSPTASASSRGSRPSSATRTSTSATSSRSRAASPRRSVTARSSSRSATTRLTTKTNKRGRFTARWKADETGTQKVKVKARGDKIAAGSKDKAGKATVYRPAEASYYGPGFYGGTTACGQTLSTGTIGVAHKTMPCGTKLKLRYGNRTVKAEVIDRGPYAGDREFDLTEATKNKLGFPSTGTVWVNK